MGSSNDGLGDSHVMISFTLLLLIQLWMPLWRLQGYPENFKLPIWTRFIPALPTGKQAQAGASRARSGEQKASKGNFILIVPLDPAYPANQGRDGALAGQWSADNVLTLGDDCVHNR
jgi:hypothetical protein